MSPPRVLVVSDYAYPSGGVEHFVCEFLSFAIARGVDCRLLTWTTDALVPGGFESVVAVDCGDVRGAWELMDWADVIVIPTSFNVRLLARLAHEYLRRLPKRAITIVQTSAHSSPGSAATGVQDGWLADLMEVTSVTVAVSDAVAAALAALPRPANASVVTIENAARLAGTSTRRPRQRATVSFIGRPFPQKGYPLFVRLAEELHGRGLRFCANTVSVLPARFPAHVQLSALLDDAELTRFFDATDLLVVPYLHADGLPLAVLEAINCGVPVLGFDSPAVAPLLRRHDQLVIPPDYESLRDAVEAWRKGALTIAAPACGQVSSWEQQFERYFALIGEPAGIRA